MKKLAIALVVCSFGGAACSTNLPADASGREIYEALCTRCHSADLSGGVGPALGAGSELADQPDAYLFQTITSGLGRMPSFRNTLSEDQILEVAEYLRVEQGSS
jgi:mono/diheme cytochrome c family protein